ncbi:glycerol-3-phosphate dehydrogenase, putative [Plasmodium berghei]|uniref:Glycerol-3-phosphate dehydrogenase [NAD(+)] n=2 Tax=Plasmodium berghei TaxID=5821 RepID=A0A509AV64_PLABA|nr:glycerol-3-phosphate dehydrogenase [NAD(+)], putative [Plasmodium berghei ANKA]CXJ19980.1 glycerol-3-phosphate dehydrogenase, putative [Plasmodium berghei]SCM26517.1 glycerol-3-phosphate dehydrogenase, putative [Plasmodium berghei]SCN28498.1 glycerol-3-phosphate dehydrogenase, putative [Plasmodium berghei]SCO62688.1 glycerol-3-phosphate dehydrogenase, putative [Plasmodium berghei]SCO64249.1 glycerol-3-phosphate dehydrogenase, putative [Plasmodium berghei]|eukprot:XP_034424144.1 glycerol-3-phosphate dehydrogenase [NAD(+)], putative [Plasmodium berghei ANKA]
MMHRSIFDKLKEGPLKVSIIGCGNWASAICKIVGTNAKNNYILDNEVKMWCRDEKINNESIVNIMNKTHENIKYLKGISLPHNVVANSDLSYVINNSDLLIFTTPSQYLEGLLSLIKENKSIKIAKHVKAISLTKGFIFKNDKIILCSNLISNALDIPCCALSGANIAMDIALERFSEATIGGKDKEGLLIWQRVFDIPYFKINCVNESVEVELFGAIKNVIVMAVGFCDGLEICTNSKSAIIRIGINETILFGKTFFEKFNENIIFESCGFADIITSFLAGRNARCAAEFVKSNPKKSWEQLEVELLNGQKLQGIITLKYAYAMIKKKELTEKFPLITILYQISFENKEPSELIKAFMTSTISPINY